MTTQEKLNKIARQTGFPFAINAHGYNYNNGSNNGLQAWPCKKNAEGFGVEIVVFNTKKDISWFDANVRLFEAVEQAEFFTIDEEVFNL